MEWAEAEAMPPKGWRATCARARFRRVCRESSQSAQAGGGTAEAARTEDPKDIVEEQAGQQDAADLVRSDGEHLNPAHLCAP